MWVRAVDPEEQLPGLAHRDHPILSFKNRIANLPQYLYPACDNMTAFCVGFMQPSLLPPDVQAMFDQQIEQQSAYEQK